MLKILNYCLRSSSKSFTPPRAFSHSPLMYQNASLFYKIQSLHSHLTTPSSHTKITSYLKSVLPLHLHKKYFPFGYTWSPHSSITISPFYSTQLWVYTYGYKLTSDKLIIHKYALYSQQKHTLFFKAYNTSLHPSSPFPLHIILTDLKVSCK